MQPFCQLVTILNAIFLYHGIRAGLTRMLLSLLSQPTEDEPNAEIVFSSTKLSTGRNCQTITHALVLVKGQFVAPLNQTTNGM